MVDKVREWGAPLFGNNKGNLWNDHTGATEIYEEEKREEEKEKKEKKREKLEGKKVQNGGEEEDERSYRASMKIFISWEAGLQKFIFIQHCYTFSTISYICLYLKLRNFPPNQNHGHKVAELLFFLLARKKLDWNFIKGEEEHGSIYIQEKLKLTDGWDHILVKNVGRWGLTTLIENIADKKWGMWQDI